MASVGPTVIYLAVLARAMGFSYTHSPSLMSAIMSACLVGITWFYIVRFMCFYEGPNVFDDAYADVVWGGSNGNWWYTQLLLGWVPVALVWSHAASIQYQIFGVFGAMSGSYFVLTPPALTHKETKVPAHYLIFAALAYICTGMLPASTTKDEMSWWLWGLHACLLIPKAVPRRFNCYGTDACFAYLLLGVLSFGLHVYAGRPGPWPATDCRISITIDAIACSVVTLLWIHKANQGLLTLTALAGFLVPVASPGCVLAVWCALQHGLCGRLATLIQCHVSQSLRNKEGTKQKRSSGEKVDSVSWMNLGYWETSSTYAEACSALALRLGQAILQKNDRVLCLGCGPGEELAFFQKSFDLRSVTGVDGKFSTKTNSDHDPVGPDEHPGAVEERIALKHMRAEDLSCGPNRLPQRTFDRVIALDSFYHMDKSKVLSDVAPLLVAGGSFAVTDVIVSASAPAWVRAALAVMGLPLESQWSKEDWNKKLSAAGFRLEEWSTLEPHVLRPWRLPEALLRHLDYVLITATLNPRRTVAVVGSGMSGCVAAHLLSKTHDVTVFEAGPLPGLGGRALQLNPKDPNSCVDIPLRLMGPCYYQHATSLIQGLGVNVKAAHLDACFFETSGNVFAKTEPSPHRTAVSCWRHLPDLVWLCAALWRRVQDGETLGDWACRTGVAETQLWTGYLRRQLCWMLSCTYQHLADYPANVVLQYVRAASPLSGALWQETLRVHPSVRAMEAAMLGGGGIEVRCGNPVAPIGSDRRIGDQEFDAVVVATEAAAVSKVVPRDWTAPLKQVVYHPSTLVVHSDTSLMPPCRADWRTFNVHGNEEGGSCMLTVWLNNYFPDRNFDGDMFQTWNPVHEPANVIQTVPVQRAVHTLGSRALQSKVAEIQGHEGFYFAGAYCVPGMGLLEEAVKSAELAVAALHRDHAAAVLDEAKAERLGSNFLQKRMD